MAILRIPDENRSLQEHDEIRDFLTGIGIGYERWEPVAGVPPNASSDQILSAYAKQIDQLKSHGGYVTVDIIDINPDTPGLNAMLAKFNIEHYHDEDEVRYSIDGRGLFHIHPQQGPVVEIEVETGDLIRVPRDMFTGSIFVVISESAQYAYSKISPAGLPTTHTAKLTENTNQSAGVHGTSHHNKQRQQNRECCVTTTNRTQSSHYST